ncbi:hypothetical protein KBY58_04215 [Cyanobium sp. HWJ4-Hawea]|nr:hypothetical protein [Cyanobium sp. HWJ4-Hawea]
MNETASCAVRRSQQQHITRLGFELHRLEGLVGDCDGRIVNLHEQLEQVQRHNHQLQLELQHVYRSRTWRIARPARLLLHHSRLWRERLSNLLKGTSKIAN